MMIKKFGILEMETDMKAKSILPLQSTKEENDKKNYENQYITHYGSIIK